MSKRKMMSVLLGAVMAAGTLSVSVPVFAEEAGPDVSQHVDITIGGINVGDSESSDRWPNEVVDLIEEKFNVTLKCVAYDNESLNLDLSGGTTADIVQINDDHIESVVRGKHAVNLEDYADIATNIFSDDMAFRNEILKAYKSNDEGVQYFVTPRVTFADTVINYGTVLNNGYIVRYDLYKEIGCPDITNDDEYIEALKAMKEIYPETEDGLPTYAMSVYNDSQLHAYFYKGCLSEGYSNLEGGIYVQNAVTNELVPDLYDVGVESDTPFWAGVKFYNKLYREGLLDPDVFITKSEDIQEKYDKGQYLGGVVNWYYGNYNSLQRAADPETLKEYITLPSHLGWANEKNLAGWFGKYFFVSSHSPNAERAVMILDYLQGEECSRIVDSGTDTRWGVNEDGVAALTEDTLDLKTNGARLDEYNKSGINAPFLSDMVGEDHHNFADDGSRVDLWYADDVLAKSMTFAERDLCETLGLEIPSDMLKKHVEAGVSIDLGSQITAIQLGMPTTPRDIVRIDSNCEELTLSALPGLVQAESDEEFAAAKEALVQQLKDAGAEDSVAWWTEAWKSARETIEGMLQ